MSRISLQHIYKSYQKNNMVINDLSLEIFDDEFLVLVGPSGCGKTTTLRMIAGLEEITKGDFYIDDLRQNDKDPSSRRLSFVFQNYALLPNLTIFENIEFGLLNKKMTKLEKHKEVEGIAKKLSLYEKLGNYPHQLSGGQRQRVALARALVDGEKLVLFDEPLSNLDAVLRAEMRTELIRFKKQYEVTGIYVTHDQIEAMSMATRIALIIDGRIIQVGTPVQMYNEPNSLEVASFIGAPEINILMAKFDGSSLVLDEEKININDEVKELLKEKVNEEIYYTIRPHDVKVYNEQRPNTLEAKVEVVENFGYNKLIHIDIHGMKVSAVVETDFTWKDKIYVDLAGKNFIFDRSRKRISNFNVRTIMLDNLNNLSADDYQALRELANYGYKIIKVEKEINNGKEFDDGKEFDIIIRQKGESTFEITKLNLKLNSLKELLNHLSDVRNLNSNLE